ncbi:Xaa-Pro aminopeptidase ApepP [Pseudolycoriella hygida]|uniref:Xaa-Pro aminopeptidase ApepP n=1 Tax=Pseudolycoriella hygida TaxID=35572 RepID=A0A9Q0MZT0_9DIPT|nr:Xaa-Pro aminopeptidase ApepP [Pseudolycoriella hygida]
MGRGRGRGATNKANYVNASNTDQRETNWLILIFKHLLKTTFTIQFTFNSPSETFPPLSKFRCGTTVCISIGLASLFRLTKSEYAYDLVQSGTYLGSSIERELSLREKPVVAEVNWCRLFGVSASSSSSDAVKVCSSITLWSEVAKFGGVSVRGGANLLVSPPNTGSVGEIFPDFEVIIALTYLNDHSSANSISCFLTSKSGKISPTEPVFGGLTNKLAPPLTDTPPNFATSLHKVMDEHTFTASEDELLAETPNNRHQLTSATTGYETTKIFRPTEPCKPTTSTDSPSSIGIDKLSFRTPKRKNLSPINPGNTKKRILNPMGPPSFKEVIQKSLWVVDVVNDAEEHEITKDQGNLIEEELTKALFASGKMETLDFEHCGYDRGLYRTISRNTETRDWVFSITPTLNFEKWPEAKLKPVQAGSPPKMIRASIVLAYPTPDYSEVFEIIDSRNPSFSFFDAMARRALWDAGLNYGHGTGHGIGAYLNVHEYPPSIGSSNSEPGMLKNMFTSNEPGFYQEGKFGIRIEDVVQAVPAKILGDFNGVGALQFYHVTMVPLQTSLMKIELLTKQEIDWLNEYHERVFRNTDPVLERLNDADARKWLRALWDAGLNYGHGTGHGIGAYLNVHEYPPSIGSSNSEPGMLKNMFTSNEPGFYQEGKFGIRIEDVVQAVPAKILGDFNGVGALQFYHVTMVPLQTSLMKIELLTKQEIDWLNEYHERVFRNTDPVLERLNDADAREWLYEQTRPITYECSSI